MNVAMSIVEHEKEAALRWLKWADELGTAGHRLFLLFTAGWDASEVKTKAELAFFGATSFIQDAEAQTSDWQEHEAARSASGPNSSFRQIAWHMSVNKLGPWLFCETDAIPLKKGWLEALEAEYIKGGMPFMGAKVEIPGIDTHLSGNAIYPQETPSHAPSLVMRSDWIPSGSNTRYELAFDIAGAREVLPKSHFTPLIQHIFRHPGFKSRKEFEAVIDPNAVLFHSNKDGSIFRYLRNEDVLPSLEQNVFENPLPKQSPETARTGSVKGNSALMPTVSELTYQDHVKALAEYAKKDGFAKARVIRDLKANNLLPNGSKGKVKCPNVVKRRTKTSKQ